MSAPLSPVSSPLTVLTALGFHTAALTPQIVALALLVVVLLGWTFYSLIALYHWLRYSHAASITWPALIIHAVVSGLLIVFMFTELALA